mmetsp:Transcript_131311/g.366042  ORF Transcript_131311/g.366042 Transcript_131311/m.366042 type:complete len:233 (-) Transcript_131311:849-1547(-)
MLVCELVSAAVHKSNFHCKLGSQRPPHVMRQMNQSPWSPVRSRTQQKNISSPKLEDVIHRRPAVPGWSPFLVEPPPAARPAPLRGQSLPVEPRRALHWLASTGARARGSQHHPSLRHQTVRTPRGPSRPHGLDRSAPCSKSRSRRPPPPCADLYRRQRCTGSPGRGTGPSSTRTRSMPAARATTAEGSTWSCWAERHLCHQRRCRRQRLICKWQICGQCPCRRTLPTNRRQH